MGWLSWGLLLPLVIVFWITKSIVKFVVGKGGFWRLLGILTSLALGGVCIWIGYWLAIEGYTEFVGGNLYEGYLEYNKITYPIPGWIDMIGGGLIAVVGTLMALFGKKE